MSRNKNKTDNGVVEERNESFFKRMKSDKKYSAKVQLILYGVFIVVLIIYLNLSSVGSDSGSLMGNNILGNIGNGEENTDQDNTNLLKNLDENYSYNTVIYINKKSVNTENGQEVILEDKLGYSGKVFKNKLEIRKTVGDVSKLYYKVDDNYYSMIDNITSYVKDMVLYDVIDGKYIELDSVLKLIDKASLDHVTEFSSGKKVFVYHLGVKDVIVGDKSDDKVEINIEEENDILKFSIDYSNLFKVIDASIDSCKLEVMVTDIGKVLDFDVVVNPLNNNSNDVNENDNEENTSLE